MKNKNKKYIILLIFIITIFLLVAFLVFPVMEDIKNGSEEILSNKARAIFMDKEINEIDSFKKNYKDYEPNFRNINNLFIDQKNPINFIDFLEKEASESGVKINIDIFLPEKSENAVFKIYSQGNFLNTLKFLEKVERSPYLVKIKSITMRKLIGEKNLPNLIGVDFLLEVVN